MKIDSRVSLKADSTSRVGRKCPSNKLCVLYTFTFDLIDFIEVKSINY